MTLMPETLPMEIDCIQADTKKRDGDYYMPGHHCHSCYELYYVHSGSSRFLVEDHFYDLHERDVILIPPMVLHYSRYNSGTCLRTVVLFRLEDAGKDLLRAAPGLEELLSETCVFQIPLTAADLAEQFMQRIVAEIPIQDAYSPLLRVKHLQELLLLFCRVRGSLAGDPEDIRTRDQQVLRAARYISQNYMNPITTEDVARAVNFSPNYLSRRFRVETGIGLHEYIVFVRLHHAAQELISTSDSITEIALRCGFSGSNYFKDSFKKNYGVTPRAYRNMK